MSKRLTKLDIEHKLQSAELEIFSLKNKLEIIENLAQVKEYAARAEGYRQAIQDVMQLLQKIFGKEELR